MLDTKNPLAPITVGSGFIVTVNPANVLNNGAPTNIPSTIVSLTPSATNFIHITSGGSLTVNTSGFPAGCLPIATVTCSSTSVTSVADSRPDFYIVSGAVSAAAYFENHGGFASGSGTNLVQNTVQLSGFILNNSVQFSKIIFRNGGTSDLGSNYDVGIYDSSGVLKAHTGVFGFPATFADLSIGAAVTLSSGKYYFAVTTSAAAPSALITSASFSVGQLPTFLLTTNTAIASSGGALPNSITPPADSWSFGSTVHGFTLHS